MSKREPELVKLRAPTHALFVRACDHYPISDVDPAIRSLRVKLHRERAKLHKVQARISRSLWIRRRHEKAAARFLSRADKIERGEL